MQQVDVGNRVYLSAHLPLYPNDCNERTEWIVCKVEGDGKLGFFEDMVLCFNTETETLEYKHANELWTKHYETF